MTILVFEPAWWDRKQLERYIKKATPPSADIHVFSNTKDAKEFTEKNDIDVAFLDLSGMHIPGYFLAESILKRQRCNIIFMDYEMTYLKYAMEMRVSGYLQKPLRCKDVINEFQNLRYPSQPGADQQSAIHNMAI